jgi:cobalt-zinc-cadmium efflux system outer membrane protein
MALKVQLAMLLVLTLGVTAARAQQPARLTLQSALDLAEKQNLDLAAARQRRAVALAGVRIAKQRPNPSVAFAALRDEPHEGVFFDQPVELGFKRRHRIEVAQQEGALTELDIAALDRRVRRNVREAYYTFAFARAESERRDRVLKLAQRLKQIAQERYQAGAVAELEVIQADLEVSRAETGFHVAQQQEKVSLSELNALLNEPAQTAWDLAGSLEDLPLPMELGDLIQRAGGANPELQRLEQEQKVEDRRRALLKAERIPNLDLEFGTDFNSPHDFAVGPRSQVMMTLPIFSRNQGEIAQSLANQRVLEAESVATKRAVAGRVEAAYYDLSARLGQVEIYRQTLLPSAQRLESMVEESYRAGKSNILTVLDAQRNVQQVEREYLDALLAVQTAFAGLEETVGAPLQ